MKETWSENDGGRAEAGYKGRAGDCVTRAISIAAGLPYQEVYDELTRRMKLRLESCQERVKKKYKGTARNGVPRDIYEPYLLEMGWTWTPTMAVGQGCQVHLKSDELPEGRIIVRVTKHVCAVIDGVIHDTYDCSRNGTRCVYGYYQNKESQMGESKKFEVTISVIRNFTMEVEASSHEEAEGLVSVMGPDDLKDENGNESIEVVVEEVMEIDG